MHQEWWGVNWCPSSLGKAFEPTWVIYRAFWKTSLSNFCNSDHRNSSSFVKNKAIPYMIHPCKAEKQKLRLGKGEAEQSHNFNIHCARDFPNAFCQNVLLLLGSKTDSEGTPRKYRGWLVIINQGRPSSMFQELLPLSLITLKRVEVVAAITQKWTPTYS